MKNLLLIFLVILGLSGYSQNQPPTEQHNPWYFVNGPVAIGLTTPAYTLDVLGNTNVRGYQYSYSQSTTGSRELYQSGTTYGNLPNSYGNFQLFKSDTANPEAPFLISYLGRGSAFGNPTPLAIFIAQSSDTIKNELSFSSNGLNVDCFGVANHIGFSADSVEARMKDGQGNDMLNINSNSNVSLGDIQKNESGTGVDISVPGQTIVAQTEGFFQVDDTDSSSYFTVSVASNKTTISSALQFTGSTGTAGTVLTNIDGSGNAIWSNPSYIFFDTATTGNSHTITSDASTNSVYSVGGNMNMLTVSGLGAYATFAVNWTDENGNPQGYTLDSVTTTGYKVFPSILITTKANTNITTSGASHVTILYNQTVYIKFEGYTH